VTRHSLAVRLLLAALVGAVLWLPLLARSSEFPDRPIRVVVPYPPGGMDPIARVITTAVSQSMGQPLVIENRAGANGIIGSQQVAQSKPDGYTILFGSISTHAIPVHLTKNLPFNPVSDFSPISVVGESSFYLTVDAKSPFRNVRELIEYARSNPGKLSYGSAGNGSNQHLMGEQFKRMAKVDILHVPYKGASQAQTGMMGGEVSMIFGGSSVTQLVRAGTLRHLAILDKVRSPLFPEVQSINDLYPDYQHITVWTAFFGPRSMPPEYVSRLQRELVRAIRSPEVANVLINIGVKPVTSTPAELIARINADIDLIGKIVKETGIKPE
jgi:tripartite-type tricarboxylate transporter receptor subunit TctC